MLKLSRLVLTCLIPVALFAGACSSSESDDKDPIEIPDAAPEMGNGSDASLPPPPPPPPPPAGPKSDTLGAICDETAPCATGYACLVASQAEGAKGFCSLPCTSEPGTPGECGADNGFQGPGTGLCVFEVEAGNYCGVLCGEMFGGDACPPGLECVDLGGASGCVPPEPAAP